MDDQLKLRGGFGILARRRNALLFVPDPMSVSNTNELIESFVQEAHDVDAVEAVRQRVVLADFVAPAFVAVSWDDHVELTVFGDAELTTTSASAPTLKAAGLDTWVEHRVRNLPDVAVSCGDSPPVEESQLDGGVVPAGGFSLKLMMPKPSVVSSDDTQVDAFSQVANTSPPDETTEPCHPIEPNRMQEQPGDEPPVQAESIGTALPILVPPEPVVEHPVAADQAGSDAVLAPAANPFDDEHIQAKEVQGGASIRPPTKPALAHTVPPDGMMVEAVVCAGGHANRPTLARCVTCSAELNTSTSERKRVVRPPLGSLTLPDGTTMQVVTNLTLGRRPDPATDYQAVVVDGDLVSRTHAELIIDGWDVYVRDLTSRNGTFVVASEHSEPQRLEPGSKLLVLPGAIIQLGSTRLHFRSE